MLTRVLRLSLLIVVALVGPASGQRYWALMRDGSVQTGTQLKHLDDPKTTITLDGKKLLETVPPVRTLRDTTLTPVSPAAYLEMVNGDVLAGHVLAAVTGQQATPLPDHLVVEDVGHTGVLRVRLDWVRRIVNLRRPREAWTPNYLRLVTGREIQFRSLRWNSSGIVVLLDDGLLPVAYKQIAELHVPQPQAWLPLYPGAAWLDGPSPSVVRIVTADGQVISYPHSMVTTEFDKKARGKRSKTLPALYATRPPWALELILIERDAVAWQTYFDAGEIPLSTLPVIDVVKKAALHYRPWVRDRSVQGGPLQSGAFVSESGIGMHANTQLSFALPPGRKQFTSRVGLNHLVGAGGCVHCRIWRDVPTGRPLWERKFLTGADGVQQIGPLDVSSASRLILEVDFAHGGRPQGADPLDVRDFVDWLLPIVHVESKTDDMQPLAEVIPEIDGWSISPSQLQRIKIRPFWIKRNDQWGTAIATGSEPLVLTRQVDLTLENAWLPVRATCDDEGATRTIWIRANGEKVKSTSSGNLGTHSRYKFGQRVYSLHKFAGGKATVEVVADPHKRSEGQLGGVVWDWLRLQPVIRNLPTGGQPIVPDVPLESRSPTSAVCKQKPIELLPGKLVSGAGLNVVDWPLPNGYGVPSGSEITYELNPSWRRFVAVVGLASGTTTGPFQILVDEQPVWSSEQSYGREDPGEQISVPIPAEGKTVTLKLLGASGDGAWAEAGFVK